MKKESTGHDFAVEKRAWSRDWPGSRCVRLGLIAAAGVSLVLNAPDQPFAQQRFREPAVKVTSVTSAGNVVSISADGSLNRAQTWQDPEGFHVMLVNGQSGVGSSAGGVKVRRVSNTLELVVPVRRGASVTVQPRGNRLDLVVTGGTGGALNVENFPVERRQESARAQESSAAPEQSGEAARERAQQQRPETKRRNPAELVQPAPAPPAPQSSAAQPPQPAPAAGAPPAGPVNSLGPAPAPQPESPKPIIAQPAAAQLDKGEGLGLLSFFLSFPSLFVLLGVALAGAAVLLVRRRRGAGGEAPIESGVNVAGPEDGAVEKPAKRFEHFKGDRRKSPISVPFERRTSGPGAEDEATRRSRELSAEGSAPVKPERAAESKPKPAGPTVVFGAYRIDQEVASLVSGGPHSTEVLSSRAPDDRRAAEASLLKLLRAPETDEDGRRRVRTALEDYGFVARSCAALLLGGESFERVSAARTLGDMKSAQALPFLTEALYDPDPVVRTECVQSLGALGLPSAIGALLDVARRHQDLPASVLGPALTACSVESLELGWDPVAVGLATPAAAEQRGDVRMIAPAVEGYEELPEFVEDEALSAALVRFESSDAESRAGAAQQLAQFQVRRAVRALAVAARNDAEAAVRSAAVTSLGLINHESVFAQVIIALADEAREVRAAAARALSRLSFDRADAYVRLVEAADSRMVREVAHACVKAGLAAQAISRLTSEDRRQAFEAYSLLSLCVSGGEEQPVVDAVESHRDIDTRLTCIQLLGDSRSPDVCEQLARLAGNGGVPEQVRRSILETVERASRPQHV